MRVDSKDTATRAIQALEAWLWKPSIKLNGTNVAPVCFDGYCADPVSVLCRGAHNAYELAKRESMFAAAFNCSPHRTEHHNRMAAWWASSGLRLAKEVESTRYHATVRRVQPDMSQAIKDK